jgi:hypothetical protein
VYGAELPALETPVHVQARVVRTAARLRVESERALAEQRLRHVGISTLACSAAQAALVPSVASQPGIAPQPTRTPRSVAG